MNAPTTARALFAAAREDGPDADERDAVFRKIALTTGVAAGAAAGATALSVAPSAPGVGAGIGVAAVAVRAASSASAAATPIAATAAAAGAAPQAATGGVFGLKLLSIGVALGAVCTALGVVLALTVVTPEGARGTGRAATTVMPATITSGAKLAQPATRRRDANDGDAVSANAEAHAEAKANADARANANANAGSDLAEEARLVTAARTALMSGDPAHALSLVQATRKLGARSLEPEELGLEARALRALGRADDAAATELVLRRRYPEHALAR